MPRGAQAFTEFGGAPALPDDGIVERLAALAVPEHRRLALVGNADRDNLGRPAQLLAQHRTQAFQHRFPDIIGPVFHPARLWVVLRKLHVGACAQRTTRVHQGHGAARCALVDREDELAHGRDQRSARRNQAP